MMYFIDLIIKDNIKYILKIDIIKRDTKYLIVIGGTRNLFLSLLECPLLVFTCDMQIYHITLDTC